MGEELQIGAAVGELELRASGNSGARRIKGRFPYGKRAVLSDGGKTGRPRKEVIAPKAFAYRVERRETIHLLVGHSYDRPLASTDNGSLALRDTPEALIFDAQIAPELEKAPFFQDFWGALLAGLIGGVSPGSASRLRPRFRPRTRRRPKRRTPPRAGRSSAPSSRRSSSSSRSSSRRPIRRPRSRRARQNRQICRLLPA